MAVKRLYGSLRYDPERREWALKGDPHVVSRAKRVFPRISSFEFGEVRVAHSPEVARDLEWFETRYPLRIGRKDRELLRARSREHQDEIATLDQIVGGKYAPRRFELALPLRPYQAVAAELHLRRGRLLLADELGLGKTVTAIASFTDPRTLPALVVSLAGRMPSQWAEMIAEFAPGLFVHILKKKTPYALPKKDGRSPDVLVSTYAKLSGWTDVLAEYCQSAVFDECQELRRTESRKYQAAREIGRRVRFAQGLSATPIYNYGGEIYNVLDALAEGSLGPRDEWNREWCTKRGAHHVVREPKALGSWLAEQHLLLRRSRRDVGREIPAVSRIPHTVDFDEEPLAAVEDRASELARLILDRERRDRYRGESMEAAEELSAMLRQATGVSKAPYAADFLRLLVESGEPVVVYAWHRAVYAILEERLKDKKPAFFTGSESPKEKDSEMKRFLARETPLLFMSLRAAAGLDGLQKVCRTVVFAELDWSHGVHEQAIGRVARDGQEDPVAAYFLVSEGGSDPPVAERLGLKRAQADGLRDPDGKDTGKDLLESDARKTLELAEYYLRKVAKRPKRSETVDSDASTA